jgi:hypothetical protein
MVFALLTITVALFAENKYALLIANSNYKNFSSLDGPIKEARSLSTALKLLGFTVVIVENGAREKMLDELDSIKLNINGKGGIALFHYGGHGVQAQGKNYLIPIDADIPDEKKLSTRTVDIDEVMSSLDSCGSETNIVILDACRNNPLPAGSGRSASRGLSVVEFKPKNSIIVYSAEAGTVAQDGLFTPTLTKLITQSGKSFNQILMQLRREVSQRSNGAQIPGEYNQLFDDIYLNGTKIISSGSIDKTKTQIMIKAYEFDKSRSQNIEAGEYWYPYVTNNSGNAQHDLAYYTFNSIAGKYKLLITYAAATSRPVDITLNGSKVFAGALRNTSGDWRKSITVEVGDVYLIEGFNIFIVENYDYFPHLESYLFIPY